MNRRLFLQSIAAGVTSFALPIRTTVAENGEIIYVFELSSRGGIYGFRAEVPDEEACLVTVIPAKGTTARMRYLHTQIEPNRILLFHSDWLLDKIDASFFSAPEMVAASFPSMTEANPLWLKARSVTGKPETLCITTCIDVWDNATLLRDAGATHTSSRK